MLPASRSERNPSSVENGGTVNENGTIESEVPRSSRVSQAEVPLRRKIYALFDPSVPASSKVLAQAATAVSITIFLLIYISITVFCIESHPEFYQQENVILFTIEVVCVAVFTIEFITKLATTDNRGQFCRSLLNWIDFISILPFYVDLFVTKLADASFSLDSLVFLRVIRLARVFRVFKLRKYSTGLQLVIYAMRQSSEALSLLGFLLGIALVLFASLIYIAEQSEAYFDKECECWMYNWNSTDPSLGIGPVRSQFQSIPDSFWWALVTLATVGYGDQVPRTWFGKAVGIMCMIVGVLVLAFPIILISNNFSDAVKEFNLQQKEQKEEEERAQAMLNSKDDDDLSVPGTPLEALSPNAASISPTGNDIKEHPSNLSLPPLPSYKANPLDPGPNTIVAHMKHSGKMRPIFFVDAVQGDLYQFRYDPLFYATMGSNGALECTLSIDDSFKKYMLQIEIVLDTASAQQHAVDALNKTGLFERRKVHRSNTFAHPLARVLVSIPTLHPAARLITTEFLSPGTSITVVLETETKEELDALRVRLCEYYVHCHCTLPSGNSGRQEYEITVPLLMAAHALSADTGMVAAINDVDVLAEIAS
eukprot:Sspe_Gene.27905::Locus_12334_Transcript_1_1_Confidence_1.000_Length_1943::g.27905::m.27905